VKVNPYRKPIGDIKEVLRRLIALMSDPAVEMPIFKNMAAVYVSWQADLHIVETIAFDWDAKQDKLRHFVL